MRINDFPTHGWTGPNTGWSALGRYSIVQEINRKMYCPRVLDLMTPYRQRKTYSHAASEIREYVKKRKLQYTVTFAAIAGVGVSFHFFFVNYLLHNKVTFIKAISNSILIFLGVFTFIVSAHLAGGKLVKGDVYVSPWFAWFVAGAFFVFWVGAFWFGTLYPGGFVAVGVWSIALASIWAVNCMCRKT